MKRYRRLRRLQPDAELIRRRAAGEIFRQLAPDYGVALSTLSRYFARPDILDRLPPDLVGLSRARRRLSDYGALKGCEVMVRHSRTDHHGDAPEPREWLVALSA